MMAEFKQANAIGFYVYRDLRDVLASLAHKDSLSVDRLVQQGAVERLIDQQRRWMSQPRMLVCRYEDMMADLPGKRPVANPRM